MLGEKNLAEILACPQCQEAFGCANENGLACPKCGQTIPIVDGVPHFIPVPKGIKPNLSKRLAPGSGGLWRQANWAHAEKWLAQVAKGGAALEVGAGNGYYSPLFEKYKLNYLANDLYPFPSIDFVADLCSQNILRKNSLDFILLANVLEHTYSPMPLIAALSEAMKPKGLLVIMVPFVINLHQQPYDFNRYTHHALTRLIQDNGLKLEEMEAVYTPNALALSFVNNLGLSYTWRENWKRSPSSFGAHFLTRICRKLLLISNRLCPTDVHRQTLNTGDWPLSKWPMGYQLAACKI